MPAGRLIRTWSQCSAGDREMIVPVPSTWPCTRCPPRRSARRTDCSRLTGAPALSAPRPDRSRVSPMTSAVKVPSRTPVTVRHTPLTAIESPGDTPSVEPRMVSQAASPRCSMPATSPSSATIPVNIRACLLEARCAVRLRGWRGYMRTRIARPTCADRVRAASHPDFNRRSRNFTGSTDRWQRTGRGLSPPVRSFTDPGARSVPNSQCAIRVIPRLRAREVGCVTGRAALARRAALAWRAALARRAALAWRAAGAGRAALAGQAPELVPGAVLGDQALTMHRAELAPEPADMDVDGAAVTPDVPVFRPVRPDVFDEVAAAEHGGRVRAEEGQQLELLEGQHDLGAVDPDPALDVVDEQTGRGLREQVRLARGGPRLRAAGCADRVADDGQRGLGARDGHDREQRRVPAGRRNVLVPGSAGFLDGRTAEQLRSDRHVASGHSPIVK